MTIYTVINDAKKIGIPVPVAIKHYQTFIVGRIAQLSEYITNTTEIMEAETVPVGKWMLSDRIKEAEKEKAHCTKQFEDITSYYRHERQAEKKRVDASDIKQSVRIEDLIGKPQRVQGNRATYFSPLRDDGRTPSFSVDIEKNLWFDHVLGEGGTVIDLYMKLNNTSLPETLKALSQMA